MKKLLLIISCLVSVGLSQRVPAEPVIRVTLLGTGVPLLNASALKASGRALSGLLVEAGSERMLFDCGQGVYTRLVESGGSILRPTIGVDKVFVSHLHSDHIADLGALYSLGALYRYASSDAPAANLPLRVWGPSMFKPSTNPMPPLPPYSSDYPPVGIKPMMENFHKAYETDFYVRQLFTNPNDFSITDAAIETMDSTAELPDATSGVVYSSNGVKVTAFLVKHDPMTPAYGFRVDYQGRSFVYSGDTTYSDTAFSILNCYFIIETSRQ